MESRPKLENKPDTLASDDFKSGLSSDFGTGFASGLEVAGRRP